MDISDASCPAVKQVKYETVTYEAEALNETINTMDTDIGTINLSGYKSKVSYIVLEDDEDTGFRIYYLDDDIWIAHFSWYGKKAMPDGQIIFFACDTQNVITRSIKH